MGWEAMTEPLAIVLCVLVTLALFALGLVYAIRGESEHPRCPDGYAWTPEGAKGGTCRRVP